jgi:hypothetical protein
MFTSMFPLVCYESDSVVNSWRRRTNLWVAFSQALEAYGRDGSWMLMASESLFFRVFGKTGTRCAPTKQKLDGE